MNEKPQRRRFRFGLLTLLLVVAVAGVVVSVWNPLDRRPSRANLGLIEPGMTVADVARLVGEADEVSFNEAGTRIIQAYRLDKRESWWVYYVDGKVRESNPMSRLQADW